MAPNTSFTKADAIPADATYNPSNLAGKSVIITGGASGIGEATMRAFVKAGAFVTFGDFAEDLGQQLASELGPDKVAFVHCNVWDWNDQVKLFKTALEKSSSRTIDIVVANAGISGQDDVYHQKEDADGGPVEPNLAILKTNLIGVIYTVKLAQFYFPKQPEGEGRDRCLLMTSSLAGYLDQVGSPQYNSSKWGVRGLMRSVRRSGPWNGIRVNIISPGFIATRILSQEVIDKVKARGVFFAEVEDAASAFLHFASDKSLNGRSFTVVSRDLNPRGYFDLEKDDFPEGEFLTDFQNLANNASHRIGTK